MDGKKGAGAGLAEVELVDGASGEVRSGFSNAVIARQPLEPENARRQRTTSLGQRQNGANQGVASKRCVYAW